MREASARPFPRISYNFRTPPANTKVEPRTNLTGTPMTCAVEIDHVTKNFGAFTAVNDLSLQIPANAIYGFIGPNGSGKTTTLRMIMRIYLPDQGTVKVLGDDSWHAASDRIAYLPEERGLYKQMKVKDLLRFYAELKGFTDSKQAIVDWLERMNLTAWADKKVEALSKGMSQKVQFIATVIAKPDLVLLDEPFSGLDPVNAEIFREAVLNLKRQGSTVIFSTHDMGTAEKMCDYIFMIYKGKKVLDGTLDSIQDAYGTDTLVVSVDGAQSFEGLPGVEKVSDFGNHQELRLARGADSQRVLAQLMQRGHVRRFEQTRPSLQDIFVRIAAPSPEEHHA
jgi:ABC-2 type transport system ATP-binding protein